jgi:hypothetical protein
MATPETAQPIAASAADEPIPTAVGQPMPATTIGRDLAWPEPIAAVAPFEPARAEEAPRTTGAHLPAAEQAPAPLAARACPSCGLSISASARFCRRCGTPQQAAAPR